MSAQNDLGLFKISCLLPDGVVFGEDALKSEFFQNRYQLVFIKKFSSIGTGSRDINAVFGCLRCFRTGEK